MSEVLTEIHRCQIILAFIYISKDYDLESKPVLKIKVSWLDTLANPLVRPRLIMHYDTKCSGNDCMFLLLMGLDIV